jgi:two-component system NtrC family sensor kinase
VRYTTKVLTRHDDEPRIADITIHQSNDPGVTAGIAHDMTDDIRAMETVRGYAQQLEETNRRLKETQLQLVQTEKMAALGDLVAGVAHELNSPLASIHSCLEVTGRAAQQVREELTKPQPQAESIDRSRAERALRVLADVSTTGREAARRISAVVRTLRSFARLDEAELKTINLNEALDDTLRLLQHEIGPDVTLRRDFGELPPVQCYASQLNQLFWNILQNAAHALRGHGEILASTRSHEGQVEIRIADNATGIPSEILEHIFDPSFVLKHGQVRMGLGLPIAYRIAEAHRGSIRITSQVGHGTEVTILIPVIQIEHPTATPHSNLTPA